MINTEIKSEMVRLVAEDGTGLKTITLAEALNMAQETGEDVVCVNEKDEIPIVKIMNYSKYLYEKAKKDKENKKKSRLNAQDTKEIIISDSIAEHDLKIKASNADRIIKGGDKVRLTIKYKGRSIRLIHTGEEKLMKLVGFMQSNYAIEKQPKIEGNKVIMCVAPAK